MHGNRHGTPTVTQVHTVRCMMIKLRCGCPLDALCDAALMKSVLLTAGSTPCLEYPLTAAAMACQLSPQMTQQAGHQTGSEGCLAAASLLGHNIVPG